MRRLKVRYTACNLSSRPGVTPRKVCPDQVESFVFSCDYNGWADVPEEEREGIDAFEAAGPPGATGPLSQSRVEPALRLLPVRWKEAGISDLGAGRRRAA
jgi:hypothetical protein